MSTAGLLLAAGAGRRYGMPKVLAEGGAWLRRAASALSAGGCAPVVVVLGAAVEEALPLLPPGVEHVVAAGWESGMSASLRAGLAALPPVEAALVHLVDLPDVGAPVVSRLLAHAAPGVVARATFGGRPGHPVLLGRAHWAAVAASASGDAGARAWLAGRDDLLLVECGDLSSGQDRDTLA